MALVVDVLVQTDESELHPGVVWTLKEEDFQAFGAWQHRASVPGSGYLYLAEQTISGCPVFRDTYRDVRTLLLISLVVHKKGMQKTLQQAL